MSANEETSAPQRTHLEHALGILIVAGLGAALCLAIVSLFWMSLADDEAWILLGIQNLATQGEQGLRLDMAPTTTGGLHTLVEVALYWIAGKSLPVLRLFPFACFLLLLWNLYTWSLRPGGSRLSALAACCLLVAVPGTLTLSTSAFGALPATLLVIWGIRLWAPGEHTLLRSLAAGAVLGLAAATRVQCIVAIPALLAAAALAGPARREHLASAALASVSGLTVFALCYLGLVALSPTPLDSLWIARRAAGLDTIAFPLALRNWVIANGFAPLPLLVAATAASLRSGFGTHPRGAQLRVVLCFGWLLWGAWVAAAPFAHLRYLWPALACFAFALGPALASLSDRASQRARVAALVIATACLLSGCVTTVRNLTVGDLSVLHWEWREKTPVLLPRPGRPIDQRLMADHLRALPARQKLVVLSFGLELEFLSGRAMMPIGHYASVPDLDPRRIPRNLVVTPHVGERVHLLPEAQLWLQENCVLTARFGDYSLYRVTGNYPRDLSLLEPRPEPIRPSR